MTTYAKVKVRVEELERAFLIHGAQTKFVPFVSYAHPSKAHRRHTHTCEWREGAVAGEFGSWGRRDGPKRLRHD